MASKSLETEVELLKREVTDMKQIHVRLDLCYRKDCRGVIFTSYYHNCPRRKTNKAGRSIGTERKRVQR